MYTRVFEAWFKSYCDSDRSEWLDESVEEDFKAAAYEAFNEGVAAEKNREALSDLANT